MIDYTDEVAMADLFFERNGREPTPDELADFMVEYPAYRADALKDQARDRLGEGE